MAEKTFQWDTKVKLPCEKYADVLIVLEDPTLVLQHDCPLGGVEPETTEETDFDWHTIAGQISSVTVLKTGCVGCGCNPCCCKCKKTYRYIISYDDAQLETDTVLTAEMVQGVLCNDAAATYVRDEAGQDVTLEQNEETGVLTLTTQHGCRYNFGPFLTAAPAEDDMLEWSTFVPAFSANGALVVDSFVGSARFAEDGKVGHLSLGGMLTLSGVASDLVYLTLPFALQNNHSLRWLMVLDDGVIGVFLGLVYYQNLDSTTVAIRLIEMATGLFAAWDPATVYTFDLNLAGLELAS